MIDDAFETVQILRIANPQNIFVLNPSPTMFRYPQGAKERANQG